MPGVKVDRLLAQEARFSRHLSKHHLSVFQYVVTLCGEAGRMPLISLVSKFMLELENFENMPIKVTKRLLPW